MNFETFSSSAVFNWVVMPFLIFLARVCDVSIGTFRILLITRGKKFLAPLLAFVEAMIWLLAVRQVILNLTNGLCYFAFAGGFAVGNYVGMILEEKIALGLEVIRIITKNDIDILMSYFKNKGYGVTLIAAQGTTGPMNILFSIFNRRDRQAIVDDIRRLSPKSFYTIEDIRTASEGIFPAQKSTVWRFLSR